MKAKWFNIGWLITMLFDAGFVIGSKVVSNFAKEIEKRITDELTWYLKVKDDFKWGWIGYWCLSLDEDNGILTLKLDDDVHATVTLLPD